MSEFEYKYREGSILNEIREYINKTYTAHYGRGEVIPHHLKDYLREIQALELMASTDIDLAYHFCQASILKYAQRIGKKAGEEFSDSMKIIHYGILLRHFQRVRADLNLLSHSVGETQDENETVKNN